MSSTIDERVVEMRFDNKQFEDNIQDSIASLDELKRSLDLNTSATKLNNVIRIFNGVKSVVGGVTRGALSLVNHTKNFVGQLTGVSSLFGHLRSEVAQTVQALTGGGIQAGFQEYELKLNSVRTILSNVERSGKNLGDVSDALEKLNKYADQTIYNFGEMTRNIGYFTVAGVDLDKSVAAIKGFSNLAALSGVDSTRAARATYQLSQAMSTGSVRLMDWRSMENAGMGGQQFQDLLIEVAKKSGVQYDALLKKHKSFRETLQKGWLTSDIMLKTLQIYSGDFGDDFIDHMDGINADTIEASFAAKAYREALEGNSEALDRYGLKLEDLQKIESKEDRYKMIAQAIAATDITKREAETVDYLTKKYGLSIDEARKYYDIAVKANEAAKEVTTVTKLLDALKEAAQSGWSASWEIIIGNLDEAKKIWTAVNDEIGGILQKHADNRNELLKKWKELGGRDSFFNSISNFYFGIKGIAGHFSSVLGTMFKPLTAESLTEKTKSLEKLSKTFYTFVYGDEEAGIESGLSKLTPLFTAIGNAIGFVRDSVSKLISRGWNAFVGFITNPNVGAGFSKIASGLSSIFQKLRNSEALTKLSNLFGSLLTPVANALGSALSWVADVVTGLYSKLSELGIIDSISRAFGNAVDWLTKQGDKIGGFFNKIAAWFSDSGKISAVIDILAREFTYLRGAFSNAKTWISDTYNSFKQSNVFKFLSTEYSKIKASLTSFYTKTKDWIKKSPSVIGDIVKWFKDPKLFSNIGNWFKGVFGKIGSFFSGLWKSAKEDLFGSKSVKEIVASAPKNFIQRIRAAFEALMANPKEFFNSIKSKVGSFFSGLWAKIKSFLFGDPSKDVVSAPKKFMQRIRTAFEALIANPKEVLGGWLKKAFDSIKTVFSSFFAKAKEWGKNSPKILKDVGGFFVGLWDGIKGFFSQITKNTKFGEFVSKLKSRFMQLVDKIKPVFQTVWTKIKDTFNKIFGAKKGSGSVAGGGGGGAPGVSGSGGAPNGNPFFERLKDFFASIPGALKAAFTWLGDKLSAAWAWVKTTAIPKIVSFFKDVIAFVNETVIPLLNSIGFNRLAKGVDKLGTGIGDLGAAIKNIAKAKTFEIQVKKIQAISKVILSIAAVLAIVVASIIVLSKIPKDDYKNVLEGLKYVGALIAGILVFAVAMAGITKFGGKEFVKTGDMLLKMAASIALMVIVIVAIRQLIKSGNVGELAVAAAIAFGMMVLMTMIGRMLNSSPGKHAGTTLLGMAGAIFIMTFCVKRIVKLVKTCTPDELTDAMVIVAALGGILTLMARFIGNGTGDLKKSSTFLIAAAGSIFLMTIVLGSVIDMIRSYSVGELIGGIAVMAALAGIVAGMGWLLNSAKGTQWGSSAVLIAAVGAVYTLVIVLKSVINLIKTENDGTIWHAVGILAALGGIIAGMGFILNSAKGVKWTSSFVLVAASGAIWAMYTLLSVVTKFVQNNNAGNIWHAYGIITALGALVTVMSLMLGNLKGIKVTSIATLITTVVVLGAMVGLLAIVKKMTKYQKTAGDLWKSYGVILALGGLVTVMSTVLGRGFKTVSWDSLIKGIVMMSAAVAALVIVCSAIKSLASMDQKSLVTASGSLVAILIGVIASVWALNKIGWRSAMKGTLILAAITAIFTGFVIGLGYLFNDIDGLEARFEKGKETLRSIGEAIGGFFGGIASGVSDSYPAIGTNLTTFGENASGFFDNFMPKLAKFKMEDFQKLTEFTGALGNLGTDKWKNEFSLGMGLGWDSEKDVTTNIFDILASRFTRKKQLSDIFTMKQDFTEYATALSGLMGSIQTFMGEASGFTSEQLSSVNGSFTLVRDFLNGLNMKLPSLAEVEGEVDSGKFSLGKLGKGLLGKIFGDGKIGASASSTGIDAKIKQNFADLGTMLSSVLDAADDFMINVSSKVTEDSFPAIEKAFNLVTGYITSVSNLSMPEETTVEGGAGSGNVGLGSKKFGLDMKGIGGAYVQRASLAALGAAASAILNASETFITSTANINEDSFPAIEKAFNLVATYVQSFSGMSLPVENTTAGGGLAAGGGWGFAGAIGGAYVQRSALSVLGNVASSILASASDFITKTADINEKSFPAIEEAFNLVGAYVQNFNGLTLPSETSLWGGNVGAMGLGVTAFSYIKRASLESLGDAAAKILEAAGPFIEKAKDFEGKDQELTTAFGHVTTFLGALSEIKLPEEKSLKGLLVGLFGGFKYTENAKLSELTTFVTGLLREVGAFITLATSTSGKKAEIDDAFKHVTDLLGAINALTLKKEYSTAAGLLAASSEAVAIAGYANDTYTNFENLTSFVTTVLPAVSDFIDSAKNLTSDETNKATTLFTCVTSLLGGISKIELPTETETASGILAWSGSGSEAAILGHSGDYKTAFDNLATVLPALISSVEGFVTATKDLTPEGAAASATALGAVSTLLGAVNGFTLPEEMSDGWGLFAETSDGGTIAGRTKTVRADFGKFARELGRIITSCQSIFEYASKLSGEELGRVQTAIELLNTFLTGFNGFKLPEETEITYFGAFKGRVESYKTSFDEMVGSISGENGLLSSFAGFIESVKGLTESENNSVSSAVNDLVSFLNSLNDFKPPKKATKEWWGIAEQFTTLGDIANALPELGTNLGKFYTNFTSIEGSVDAFNSLYDIMGGESAKSAAVVGFLSDSISLLKNLWTLNDNYGTLEDKYWIDENAITNIVKKLGLFVQALSASIDNGDLDDAFGAFATFGSKVFEKITEGFSNTDSITTLRDALSTALSTALSPDAMPDEVGSFDSVIAQINALLEEGIDTAPTIRPVLDLSQLTADVKSMDELFAAGGIIHMSSSKQNAEEANALSAQLSQHTSTVVNAINSMGTKIDNLGNSIKSMKIVLNTGILAGAMAPDMDKALGARSDSTRRGSTTSNVPSYVV